MGRVPQTAGLLLAAIAAATAAAATTAAAGLEWEEIAVVDGDVGGEPAARAMAALSGRLAEVIAENATSSRLERARVVVSLHALAYYGDAGANELLGVLYGYGALGFPLDPIRSLVADRAASAGGSVPAMHALGVRFAEGLHGVPRNCSEAKLYLEAVATEVIRGIECGVPARAYGRLPRLRDDMGNRARGPGAEEIRHYLEHAAAGGSAQALTSLGNLLYAEGDDSADGPTPGSKALREAQEAFDRAAAAGDAVGANNAAHVLLTRAATERWDAARTQEAAERARGLFAAAVAGGATQGRAGLGLTHELLQGDWRRGGVSESTVEAFAKGAEEGSSAASFNLALVFLRDPRRRDFRSAFTHMGRAAQGGSVRARFAVGKMHAHGVGTSRSCPAAAEAFRAVAARGQWVLGLGDALGHVRTGRTMRGLLGLLRMAHRGYTTAAADAAFLLDRGDAGDGDAWFDAAAIAAALAETRGSDALAPWARAARLSLGAHAPREEGDGEGGASEPWAGACIVQLLGVAARAGDQGALLLLGDYHSDGRASRGGRSSHQTALQAYLRAAEAGSAQAMFNVGCMFEKGAGVERDWHLAKRYFDQAAAADRDAWAPVALALARLGARQLWHAWAHPEDRTAGPLPQWTSLNRLLGRGPGSSSPDPPAAKGGARRDGLAGLLRQGVRAAWRALGGGGRIRLQDLFFSLLAAALPIALGLVLVLAHMAIARD